MIGVDSNLLLRLFVEDDADQHRRALEFFSERSAEEPVNPDGTSELIPGSELKLPVVAMPSCVPAGE